MPQLRENSGSEGPRPPEAHRPPTSPRRRSFARAVARTNRAVVRFPLPRSLRKRLDNREAPEDAARGKRPRQPPQAAAAKSAEAISGTPVNSRAGGCLRARTCQNLRHLREPASEDACLSTGFGRLEVADPLTLGLGVTGGREGAGRERRRNDAALAGLACFQRLKRTKLSQNRCPKGADSSRSAASPSGLAAKTDPSPPGFGIPESFGTPAPSFRRQLVAFEGLAQF